MPLLPAVLLGQLFSALGPAAAPAMAAAAAASRSAWLARLSSSTASTSASTRPAAQPTSDAVDEWDEWNKQLQGGKHSPSACTKGPPAPTWQRLVVSPPRLPGGCEGGQAVARRPQLRRLLLLLWLLLCCPRQALQVGVAALGAQAQRLSALQQGGAGLGCFPVVLLLHVRWACPP